MSDQTNVFDNPEGNNNPAPATNNDNYSAMLASIKNERGEQKYKNIEEALKALQSSQEYIPKLHQEIDNLKSQKNTLEEQYEKALSIGEKIDLLLEERDRSGAPFDDNGGEPPPPEPKEPSAQNNLNTDDLYRDFRQRMRNEEASLVQQRNFEEVNRALSQMYGDKAYEFIANKSTEYGMSVEQMKQLASTNPKAALSLLGVSGKKEMNISNSYNSSNFKTTEDNEIRRNQKSLIGGTTADINNEFKNSSKMVEQLHERGMSINDLTNPQNYYKIFNK